MNPEREPLSSILARMKSELEDFNSKRPVPTNPATMAVKSGDAAQFVEVGHE